MFAKRVLVAFDTGRGLVYAQASGWQRGYLLWTFRNFHSLPQKVLNPRQQELIATLYQTASFKSAHELDGAVIGTVEEICQPSRSQVPVTAEKVPVISAGSSGPFYARFAFSRTTLKAGAGALMVMVAAVAWHQLRPQAVSAAGMDSPAAVQRPSEEPSQKAVIQPTVPSSVNLDAAPLPATPMASADQITATPLRVVSAQELTASPSPKVSPVFNKCKPDDKVASSHRVHVDLGTHEASVELPRMRISLCIPSVR